MSSGLKTLSFPKTTQGISPSPNRRRFALPWARLTATAMPSATGCSIKNAICCCRTCVASEGISETLRLARLADVFGLSWASHVSTNTAVHMLAGLHLGAATPNCFIWECLSGFTKGPFGNCLLIEPLALENGHTTLNGKPDLGIDLDECAIEALTVGSR